MKVAIIGGGASGMVTAYLLDKKHDVTVFEKQPILGGNIRTINKNVTGVDLDQHIKLDNGVIEFEETNFVKFNQLMTELGVDLVPVDAATRLFLADGRYYLSPSQIPKSVNGVWARFQKWVEMLPVGFNWWRFYRKSQFLTHNELYDRSVGDFFGDSINFKWSRMLLMYCYSIAYECIDDIPAVIGLPITRDYGMQTKWNRIEGGVYTYIEKILAQFGGQIICNAAIQTIHRTPDQVKIRLADSHDFDFDKVVFATPPDQVLQLLADPTEAERKRFGAWKGNHAKTVIHTDLSMYQPYGLRQYCEFDVFEKEGGKDAGYNAYLNALAGLPSDHRQGYNLSFNLEDRIDPASILHVQEHHTPFYTVEAMRYRPEVQATNGENHTYHAGAYLGNGLHEGAVTAALAVSKLLGGKLL